MRWHRALLVIGMTLAAAAPVAAQSAVLQVIPDDVLGFVVINRVGQTNDKVNALAKRMKIELPGNLLEMAKGALGVDKGLADKGTLAVAVFEPKQVGDDPRGLVYFPVADYKGFIDQLQPGETKEGITALTLKNGKAMVAGKRGAFAVLTEAEHRALLERALQADKTLAAAAEPVSAWLTDHDVAGVLTEHGIRALTKKIGEGIDAAKQNLGFLPPEAKFVEGLFDGLDRFFKSVATDVTHVGLGSRLDDAGHLHLDLRAQFRKDSGFAKAGSQVKPAPGGAVAGLPSGPFIFAFGGAIPEHAMQALMNFNVEMLKSTAPDLPADKLKKLQDLYTQMSKGMTGMSMVWQTSKENQSVFAGMAFSMQMENAVKYLTDYEANLAAVNELTKELNTPALPPYETKKVKVAGKDVIEMSMDFSKLPGVPEGAEEIFKNIFGRDGKMVISVAARDEKTVIMRYTRAEALKDLLNGEDQGLARDPDVAKAAALLPAGAQWAFYLSPKGTLDAAGNMIKAFAPIPLQLPRFPATPPIATGIRLAPQSFEVHTVVPSEVLDNVGSFINQLKRMFQGTV